MVSLSPLVPVLLFFGVIVLAIGADLWAMKRKMAKPYKPSIARTWICYPYLDCKETYDVIYKHWRFLEKRYR